RRGRGARARGDRAVRLPPPPARELRRYRARALARKAARGKLGAGVRLLQARGWRRRPTVGAALPRDGGSEGAKPDLTRASTTSGSVQMIEYKHECHRGRARAAAHALVHTLGARNICNLRKKEFTERQKRPRGGRFPAPQGNREGDEVQHVHPGNVRVL